MPVAALETEWANSEPQTQNISHHEEELIRQEEEKRRLKRGKAATLVLKK